MSINNNNYLMCLNYNIKFQINNSNDINTNKAIKNNKFVYNNNLSKKYTGKIISYKSNKPITLNKRRSVYRGVSKNGNKWQVLFMHNKKNLYAGVFKSEIIAAKIYDYLSINLRTNKIFTNFIYTKEQIEYIKSIKFKDLIRLDS